MPETRSPINLEDLSIAELQAYIAQTKLPPVDRWEPQRCGHSGIRIARDGTWYHEGEPIRRPAMVRLFSTVLRREADGRHMLVTPVEKLEIDVDRTAFRAVELITEGAGEDRTIGLKLDSGDALMVGPDHPLTIVGDGDLSPRVAVRHGLEAELARGVYYELAEIALAEAADPPGVWSSRMFFPMAPR